MAEYLQLSGYFQGQANLDTVKVAGYYYNTQAKVTFENQLSTQISEEKKFTKSKNVHDTQVSPLNNQFHTYRDNEVASTPKMTKSHQENSEERPNISQLPHLTHPTSLIQLQDDQY